MPQVNVEQGEAKPLRLWQKKLPDLSLVLARFPIAVLAMAVFTVLFIIFKDSFKEKEVLVRLCAGLIISAYVSVSMTLAREGQGKPSNNALQVLVGLIICGLAWVSNALKLNLFMGVGASILILGNMVRWRRSRNDLHVWDFTHKLWSGAVFATVGSIIFTLGLIFITEAVKSLFGLRLDSLTEDVLLPIGLGFLAPLYWLSTLPPANEDYQELSEDPNFVSKAISFLGTWLLTPLILIFALILVAYGVKIILAGTLPKGEIAQMTLPFLIIGTLTWLVLEPPFIQKKFLAKTFRKLWWLVSIPASILLMIAVFVRIREYGYTPERFALVGAVIWTLSLGLWYCLAPKAKRDIRMIPGLAATLLFIGTLSAGWISHVNQAIRFETFLNASGVVSEGNVIASDAKTTDMDSARKAKSAFRYLLKNDGEERLQKSLQKLGISDLVSTETSEDILKKLGLDEISNAITGSLVYERPNEPLSISGYDQLWGPYHPYEGNERRLLGEIENYKLWQRNKQITLEQSAETLAVFDLQQWVDEYRNEIASDGYVAPNIKFYQSETQAFDLVVMRASEWTFRSDNNTNIINISMDLKVLRRIDERE